MFPALRRTCVSIDFRRNYNEKHQHHKAKLRRVRDHLGHEVEQRDERIRQLESDVRALKRQAEKVRGEAESSQRALVSLVWRKPIRSFNVFMASSSAGFPFIFFAPLFCFFFLGPHLQHMEVPRLGVESELPLLATATATATATPDLSHVCDLPHSPRQCQILNPLRKAEDGTHILVVRSCVRFHCATPGTPAPFSIHLVLKAPPKGV